MHWPPHNRLQGIDWKQLDYALGAFEGHATDLGCHVIQLETAGISIESGLR